VVSGVLFLWIVVHRGCVSLEDVVHRPSRIRGASGRPTNERANGSKENNKKQVRSGITTK
jgi:hypothetical protein